MKCAAPHAFEDTHPEAKVLFVPKKQDHEERGVLALCKDCAELKMMWDNRWKRASEAEQAAFFVHEV
jgi:hypothetical protein